MSESPSLPLDPDTPCIRLTAEESLNMAQAIFNPREPSACSVNAAKEYLASIEAPQA